MIEPMDPVAPPERRLRARTLRECLEDPEILNPPVAVIPFLAWPGRITLIVGREKSGKSTLVGQAAAALSSGGDFLGSLMSEGRVLWLALDEPTQDLVQRLNRFEANPDTVLVADGEADPKELLRLVESFAPGVLVIDCLANLGAGTITEPGNAMQWGEVFGHLRALAKRTGVAIVLIHHSKKDGSGYRDSTAIGAQVDMILTIQPNGDAETRRGINVKGRLPQRSFSVDYQQDRYVLDGAPSPVGTPEANDVGRTRIMLEVLAGAEPDILTSNQWMKATELPASSFYRMRRTLLERGFIANETAGRTVNNRITPTGRSYLGRSGENDQEGLPF